MNTEKIIWSINRKYPSGSQKIELYVNLGKKNIIESP